ncbi:probable protein S-acyltransferase 7 [Miscanthus floridulus]|uniref:probable protein S-acyltransferase 7 n=1 Tax=Miscanthus floridulus TaxID=154761 RepID=UPI00345A7C27
MTEDREGEKERERETPPSSEVVDGAAAASPGQPTAAAPTRRRAARSRRRSGSKLVDGAAAASPGWLTRSGPVDRFFYMFVFSTTLLCLYVFEFCWVLIVKIRNEEQITIWKAMAKTPASIALIIYTFIAVWFVGGLSVFHLYLMSTNQTTYENFRYRYDQRANPYNRGVIENIKEIFFTTIPPSKNNFCGRVQQEHGLRPRPTNGFMSPNMGRAVGDIEMGRKPVAWDEPRMAAEIGDLGAGLSNLLEDKDGRFCSASPDLSRDALAVGGGLEEQGSSAMNPGRSSWGVEAGR